MSAEDEGGSQTAGNSRARIIAATQERTFKAVSRYVEAVSAIDDQDNEHIAAAELHNAVMAYYRALRPLRSEEVVEDYWTDVTWELGNEQVRGFGKLGELMVKTTRDTQTTQGFLGRQQQSTRRPVRLPPQTLIELAGKLDDVAVKLGFAPEVDTSDGQLYAIKRDPEDYGEPVDDSVPKPK